MWRAQTLLDSLVAVTKNRTTSGFSRWNYTPEQDSSEVCGQTLRSSKLQGELVHQRLFPGEKGWNLQVPKRAQGLPSVK